ncbi:hypothetical protein BH23CHL2_BH23CHL2_26650 [soil metagenome]
MIIQDGREIQAQWDLGVSWEDIEEEEEREGLATLEFYVIVAMEDRDNPRLLNRIHELWQSDDPWEQYIAATTMTVAGDHTFKDEILAARESDDEFLPPAAYMYQRMFDPVGAIPDLLKLARNGQWFDQLFAVNTIGNIYATEVDPSLRAWCEEMAEDPDEAVRKIARVALTPEWERRFMPVDLPQMGAYWSYEPEP